MENKFSQNLKTLRRERSFSQANVAEKIDVSQQCVSQWELGIIEPTLTMLWRLADLFDVSVDELIGRSEY